MNVTRASAVRMLGAGDVKLYPVLAFRLLEESLLRSFEARSDRTLTPSRAGASGLHRVEADRRGHQGFDQRKSSSANLDATVRRFGAPLRRISWFHSSAERLGTAAPRFSDSGCAAAPLGACVPPCGSLGWCGLDVAVGTATGAGVEAQSSR